MLLLVQYQYPRLSILVNVSESTWDTCCRSAIVSTVTDIICAQLSTTKHLNDLFDLAYLWRITVHVRAARTNTYVQHQALLLQVCGIRPIENCRSTAPDSLDTTGPHPAGELLTLVISWSQGRGVTASAQLTAEDMRPVHSLQSYFLPPCPVGSFPTLATLSSITHNLSTILWLSTRVTL